MDPIVIVSPDCSIKDINDAAATFFGAGRDELISKDVTEYFDNPNQAKKCIGQIFKGSAQSEFYLQVSSKAGKHLEVSVSSCPYRPGEGEQEAVILIMREISEALLQERECKHLATIVQDSNESIFSMSLDGVINSWNKGAERIYGYSQKQMIGEQISILHGPGQSDALSNQLKKLRKDNKNIERCELVQKRKDGKKIFVSVMLSPIKDADGKLIGASAISQDITRDKKVAEALTKERNTITDTNEMLSTQASQLAHQAAQMELLAEMTGLLQVCDSEDEVYVVISQFTAKLFPDASGALYVQAESPNALSIIHKWGDADPKAESLTTSECLASHRLLAHMSSNKRRTEICPHLASAYGSFLCAPIAFRGELLGVICLDWRTKDIAPEDQALTIRSLGEAALTLVNLRLRQKLEELAQALTKERKSITAANLALAKQADSSGRQASQMELLAEMTGLLQVCDSEEEVYFVISQFAIRLFPNISGALFIPSASDQSDQAGQSGQSDRANRSEQAERSNRSDRADRADQAGQDLVLSTAFKWANTNSGPKIFPASSCLAAHRAQTHLSWKQKGTEVCQHLINAQGIFSCAPIELRGELFGILCMDWHTPDLVPEDQALTGRVLADAAFTVANLKLRKKLEELSIRDPLTGLFNRRYMEEFFAQELVRSQRQHEPMSILILDIDHFKRFNDTYGHEAGDTVLLELGRFLKNHVRGSDVICRFGGEEIVMLLPETQLNTASLRAETIRSLVRQLEIKLPDKILPAVSLSIGVASYPSNGETVESIFKAADTALYSAKEAGRDRVCVAATKNLAEPL